MASDKAKGNAEDATGPRPWSRPGWRPKGVVTDAFRKRLQDEREALVRKASAPGFMDKVYEEMEAWLDVK